MQITELERFADDLCQDVPMGKWQALYICGGSTPNAMEEHAFYDLKELVSTRRPDLQLIFINPHQQEK